MLPYFIYLIFTSQIVGFFQSTLVLSFYKGAVLTISHCNSNKQNGQKSKQNVLDKQDN